MDTLIVITGPTGVGKSNLAIQVAKALSTEILSADSRQVFKGIPITTAAPSEQQLKEAVHHFLGTLSLDSYFSASCFEQEALGLLPEVFERCGGVAVVCGGSMMYIDALCKGLDDIPTISDGVRAEVTKLAISKGPDFLLETLDRLDPEYGRIVDRNNIKRVVHAIEICMESGTTYTSLRGRKRTERPFRILKFMLTAPREILFNRINTRTLDMLDQGMIDEVRSVSHLRHLNSLNTVGFKEIFRYLDGEWTLETAIARLQKNTRVYAKKQLTWFARDREIDTIDITESSPLERILSRFRTISF